ncbi:MAG: VOC family protein [Armatimonadetes bacterium]|nr:VOC family protein [Armatimonadota bacterium]
MRFAHTNIIARDWRTLADFYIRNFGCEVVPPERDYTGQDLDRGTGLTGAQLSGVHLRLPGHGPDGPTLEIYSYADPVVPESKAVNQLGYGHVAFEVENVHTLRTHLLTDGCGPVGEVVTLRTADGRNVTWCYVTDPEGNAVELQSWS